MAERLDRNPLVAVDRAVVLAIESATARASVALHVGGQWVGQRFSDPGQHHSETLLPMIDGLLAEAGIELAAVEGFAISIGPGAFTSLRIGLSTLKGLCFGTGRPVVAVSTLEALAYKAGREGALGTDTLAVPALDARRGEVYAAAFRSTASGMPGTELLLAPGVFDAHGLAAALPEGGCLIGEGARVLGPDLESVAPGRFDCASAAGVWPDAAAVGQLALPELAAGRGEDAAALLPRYVRRAEAEVLRTSERFE